jgi:hypothetical protein
MIQSKKAKAVSDLVKIMNEAETLDKALHAEQRSNVLLVSGEHYTKKTNRDHARIRDSKALSQDQKLRITKNHTQKIVKSYINNIVSLAPGVAVLPNNEREAQDKKSAEMNQSVWEYGKKRYRLRERIKEFVSDFVTIGEVIVKLTWDPNKGEFIGYQQKIDEQGQPMSNPVMDDYGQPIFDPATGQPQMEMVPDESKPVFSGDFVFKRVFAFNLRRPNGVQNLHESPWIGEVDLLHVDKVKEWVKDEPEKVKKITENDASEFYVFDGNNNGYENRKDHTKVSTIFYRPCSEYPQGYYYIFTDSVVLFEGELPGGIFPLVYAGFDEVQTSPRHRSIIKQLRPYQVEINRCASKIAEHQVTLGDDKLLVQNGSKITQGVSYPGIRSMQYTGREPVVLNGRSGAQYYEYMLGQIQEMYSVAMLEEDALEKDSSGTDPFSSLFKSLRHKKKFSMYAEKVESFLSELCETYLKLAKFYFDEQRVVPMVGKHEIVNMPEWKNTEPLTYQIKIEARSEDLETLYGKQLVINHALQYVGNKLERQDIGRMMRSMPFGNFEEGFEELTIDFDLAQNLILALDRGEQPEPSNYDDAAYVIKRLVHRMRQADFKMLPPQIQQAYQGYNEIYSQLEAMQAQKLLAAQADYIPMDGAMVKVDYYVQRADDPSKSERATVPAAAMDWLIKRLDAQGMQKEKLTQPGMAQQSQVDILSMAQQGFPQQGI